MSDSWVSAINRSILFLRLWAFKWVHLILFRWHAEQTDDVDETELNMSPLLLIIWKLGSGASGSGAKLKTVAFNSILYNSLIGFQHDEKDVAIHSILGLKSTGFEHPH